jgi:hypothetical protein
MNTQSTETVQPRRRFSKAEKRANRAIKIAEKQVILANLLTECGGGVTAIRKYSKDIFADKEEEFNAAQAQLKVLTTNEAVDESVQVNNGETVECYSIKN